MIGHNLNRIFGIKNIPSDTKMRERSDEFEPNVLRSTYRRLFITCFLY